MPVGAWARDLGLYRDRIEELAPMGRPYGPLGLHDFRFDHHVQFVRQ